MNVDSVEWLIAHSEALDATDPDAARQMRDAASEIVVLRRVQEGMTPAPAVRLMHYRSAALAACVADPSVYRGFQSYPRAEPWCDYAAMEAERYAHAMLAAERAPGST